MIKRRFEVERQGKEFDDQYVLVQEAVDLVELEYELDNVPTDKLLRLLNIGSVFVLVGGGEYLEAWVCGDMEIPLDYAWFYRSL